MFNPPPLARLPFRRPIPPHAFKTIIFRISYFVFFFCRSGFFLGYCSPKIQKRCYVPGICLKLLLKMKSDSSAFEMTTNVFE